MLDVRRGLLATGLVATGWVILGAVVVLAQVGVPVVEEVMDLRPPPASAPAPGAAQPAGEPGADLGEALTQMDFQDVDLPVLVKYISEITGKNFIIDERVRGKITIISPGRISADEAYQVFLSVLQVKGFTTVQSGTVIKIVQSSEARSSTVETVLPMRGRLAPTDQYITRLIPLEFVDANAMVPILQPMVSGDGLLAAYPKTNTLIMIDTSSQTERISEILRQLDVEGGDQQIEVMRMRYAPAAEMANLLQQALESQATDPTGGMGVAATRPAAAPDARIRRGTTPAARAAAGGGTTTTVTGVGVDSAFRIIPDERLNSLIVLAGPMDMRRIRDLIARLDVPVPLGTGRIHVYYLKYANALEVSAVLGSLVGGTGGIGGVGGVGGFGRGGFGSTGFGTGGLGAGGFGAGGVGTAGGRFGSIGSRFGSTGTSGRLGTRGVSGAQGRFGGTTGGIAGVGGVGGFGGGVGGFGQTGFGGRAGGVDERGQFEGSVNLTADPATNALIVIASPQDYDTLKEVIEKLDVRRRQVYVEAIIAEVSLSKTRELGIEFQGATSLPNGVGFGRTNLGGDINSLLTPQNLSGLVLGAASSQTVTVGGVTVPAQQAIMRALQRSNEAEILSAPTILTTDNHEAELVAGQNVPFIASRSTNEVNLANTFATIERQDVGVTLRLTPQISEGGSVRLDVYQEVSDVVSVDPQLGPTTNVRSATTTIVVRDGHTAVIGGLMANRAVKDQNRVPFLSDIPVIGNLFEFDRVNNEKTNLLIFLTPHIIRNEPEQARLSISERERLIQKPYEDRGRSAPAWDPLYRPSWEIPSDVEAEEPSGWRRPSLDPEPAAERNGGPQDVAASGAGYVLLATLWSHGQAPEALIGSNGLVALSVRADSPLAGVFRKGGTYVFSDAQFEAGYRCLETFRHASEALSAYPDGMRVSVEPPTFLHWRDPSGSAVAERFAWNVAY